MAIDVTQRIALNVRALRIAAGFTQEQLAAKCKCNAKFLSRIETGVVCPSSRVLWQLCVALNVTPNDLLRDGRTEPTRRRVTPGMAQRELCDQIARLPDEWIEVLAKLVSLLDEGDGAGTDHPMSDMDAEYTKT